MGIWRHSEYRQRGERRQFQSRYSGPAQLQDLAERAL